MKSETIIKDKFARVIAVLSIAIAILSLGLGIGNFYYQHFYTSSNVKATILYSQLRDNNICIDVAFSNIGNKYAIIKNATIIVSGKNKQEDSISKKHLHY